MKLKPGSGCFLRYPARQWIGRILQLTPSGQAMDRTYSAAPGVRTGRVQ